MSRVVIYTKSWCPYCDAAKALLNQKGVAFDERPIKNAAEQKEMAALAGGRSTVPQIFIGDRHVGGCDDLYAMDARGELDQLITA
jgi:glutaredoxin 3